MGRASTKRPHVPDVPANIIVEIGGGSGPTFIICQTIQVIPPGLNWGDLRAEAISDYIKRNMIPAAPLPGLPLETEEFRSGPSL